MIGPLIQKIALFIYKDIFRFPVNEPHPWDWYAHFIVSFVLVGLLFGIFLGLFFFATSKLPSMQTTKIAVFIASGVVFLGGLAKEIDDWNLGQRDVLADMGANTLGIGLAALLIIFLATFVVMKVTN